MKFLYQKMKGEQNMSEKNNKQITIRIDSELHKKLKIKATAKDMSINEYITSLIAESVGSVDLSGIVGE